MEVEIRINQYINGELRGAALEEFEALLKTDNDLLKEVEFYKKVDKALIVNEEVESNKNLKALMTNLGKSHIQNKTVETTLQTKEGEKTTKAEILSEKKSMLKRLSPFVVLAAAAALLLFLFLPSLQKKSNLEIAENHFKMYELNDRILGTKDLDSIYNRAKINYGNGNLQEANDQFTTYLNEIPDIPKVLLAKGCIEYKLGDTTTALKNFQKAIDIDKGGIYHSSAYWYMALCYLKNDDSQKAIKQLENIKEGQDYFKEAKELLRKL